MVHAHSRYRNTNALRYTINTGEDTQGHYMQWSITWGNMQKIQVKPSVVTRSSSHFHLCKTFLLFKHYNIYSPSLGSLGDRQGYCYDFPHSFSFLCHCLLTFLWTSFLYIDFTHIWLLIHSMLTQALIHALPMLLFMCLFMHSMLTHAQPYCTVYKDRVDTIIL